MRSIVTNKYCIQNEIMFTFTFIIRTNKWIKDNVNTGGYVGLLDDVRH